MNKDSYKTNFGALLNLISSNNYATSLSYKVIYFIYYFLILDIVFEILYGGRYILLSILASAIFVINGRKYEDRELHITEYLPISYKERVKSIFFTTDIMLVVAAIVCLVNQYIYGEISIVEYVYVVLSLIIMSNIAIVQMIMTRRSIYNFIFFDTFVYFGTAMCILVLLLNATTHYVTKIIVLLIWVLVYRVFSIKFLELFRRPSKKSYTMWKVAFVIIISILYATQIYYGFKGVHDSFIDGFKQGYNSQVISNN